MPDPEPSRTYVRETRTSTSSGPVWHCIVGGLVVAVGFVLWLIFGSPGPVATTTGGGDVDVTVDPSTDAAPATDPGDTTTNVTIDPAPDAAAPDATAPDATAPDAAAPADPADPVAPAPVEE